MTDFETWVLDNSGKVFRYWVHKKMFTPFEQQNADPMQSCYENPECAFGRIVEAIELPDGDVMLALDGGGDEETGYLEYYRLSEITLAYSPTDSEEE